MVENQELVGLVKKQNKSSNNFFIYYIKSGVHLHILSVTNLYQISAGADGGPRSRVCARLTLRSAPHRHQRIFLAHVSGRRGQKN